jgi:hypothetical protein
MAALVAAADDLMNLCVTTFKPLINSCRGLRDKTERHDVIAVVLERFVRDHRPEVAATLFGDVADSLAAMGFPAKSAILSSTSIDPRVQAECLRQIEQQPEVSGVWT